MSFFDDLIVQTALVPLVVALAAAGLLRRFAALAVALGLTAALALIIGIPALPPPSSTGRLFWSIAAGLPVGLIADLLPLSARRRAALVAAWLGAALLWLVWPALTSATAFLTLAGLVLAAAALFTQGTLRRERPAVPAVGTLVAAVAVGGTAMIGASASLGQVGFALAAATGGFLLWNWPTERHVWGASGLVASGLVVLLAAALAFFTDAPVPALLAVLPALFAERLVARLPLDGHRFGPALATVALAAISVVPAIAAVGIAFFVTGGPDAASGY